MKTNEIPLTPKREALFHTKYTLIPEGCWLWKGNKTPKGYGKMSMSTGGVQAYFMAHRVSYTIHKGVIPYGLAIDHLCMVKSCVNPDHLEAVTWSENTLRMHATQVDCIRGHSKQEYLKTRHGSGVAYCDICAYMVLEASKMGMTLGEAEAAGHDLEAGYINHAPRKRHSNTRVYLDWTKPQNCAACARPMRARKMPHTPGVQTYAGQGKCSTCYQAVVYTSLTSPPQPHKL